MTGNPKQSSKARWTAQYALFITRLVQARNDAGLTQRGAAELLGRSQSFVAKSESGERRVDIVELASFASVYQKPIDFFMPEDAQRK
jgi:transcriptional regulator with XRE-family HTH domain